MAADQRTDIDANDASTDKGHVSAPTSSLSKGGGAIRCIGQKLAANPVTGTGSMTLPIATSAGRSGFGASYCFRTTQVLATARLVSA